MLIYFEYFWKDLWNSLHLKRNIHDSIEYLHYDRFLLRAHRIFDVLHLAYEVFQLHIVKSRFWIFDLKRNNNSLYRIQRARFAITTFFMISITVNCDKKCLTFWTRLMYRRSCTFFLCWWRYTKNQRSKLSIWIKSRTIETFV